MSNVIKFPPRVDFPMPWPEDDYQSPKEPDDPDETEEPAAAPQKVGSIWFWLGAALGLSIL
jgi:hypothetical protein